MFLTSDNDIDKFEILFKILNLIPSKNELLLNITV